MVYPYNVVYPYNGTFDNTKEQTTDICYNMDESFHYQSQNITLYAILYEMYRTESIESRLMIAGCV